MSYLWQQQGYLYLPYQLHIDSVVAVIELFRCHILHPVVPIALVGWSGHYFLCSLELISCPTQVLRPSNFSTKTGSSGSLSTSSIRSSYAFCIHLISFLLYGTMFGFPSVFIPSCVNVRINSEAPGFGKQLSILSESFPSLSFFWLVVFVNVGKINKLTVSQVSNVFV